MKLMILIAVPILLGAGSIASAQPMPQAHEQHQATGQHPAPMDGQQCCCDEKMREMMKGMMTEMMQQHQGGMMMQMSPKDAPKLEKPPGQ